MLWGPDGRIWVGERVGKRITRVNPADGTTKTAVTVPDVMRTHAQDGLLGLALHGDFLRGTGNDFLYVAMTYGADHGAAETRRMLIRRYTWNAASETLESPLDLLTGLPAGQDHVSGRLVFGRDMKLYLTVGDQGFNQLARWCQPIRAQELPSAADVSAGRYEAYQGKVLRVNLDGSIPADNPMLGGVRSHVYSYGHRNAQGMAMAPDGKIYVSEHGPSMDDELNLIRAGGNYGWPHVAGYRDDRVYLYAEWSKSSPEPCSSLKYTDVVAPASVPQHRETSWSHPDFTPPIQTFFTVDASYSFAGQGNATIAPSGIDVYAVPSGGIPGWSNSVLVTSLIRGLIYRVKLNADGDAAVGTPFEYFKLNTRYRDVLVSPDGRTIYAAADGGAQHAQSILAYTYQP
jgi:PQQ-dependent dehydrogenase (s-GDH family)